ncbi:MAG: DUF4279 domain-containing protein [Saezia sp.]
MIFTSHTEYFENYISIFIYPEKTHPAEITQLLGIEPTQMNVKGESYITWLGETSQHRISAWFLQSKYFVDKKSHFLDHVDWLLKQLTPVKNELLSLQRNEDFDMRVLGVQRPIEITAKFPFTANQLQAFSELNLDVGCNVYYEAVNVVDSKEKVEPGDIILENTAESKYAGFSFIELCIKSEFADQNISLPSFLLDKDTFNQNFSDTGELKFSTWNPNKRTDLHAQLKILQDIYIRHKDEIKQLQEDKMLITSLNAYWDSTLAGLNLYPQELKLLADMASNVSIKTSTASKYLNSELAKLYL